MESDFKQVLTTAVHDYFEQQKNGKFSTPIAWMKAWALLTLFFVLYPIFVFADIPLSIRLTLVIAWGINSLLLIFNIGHDAVHGAFSRHQWINRLLSLSFNLVGANAYSWKLKHNEAHHLYTNIEGKDHDIEIDPLLRVSPHKPYRWHFRWQHWYWPLVYACFSLLIIFLVDFQIFFQERKPKKYFAQPIREWGVILVTKFFYLFYIFWIPVYYAGFSWPQVLIAFLSLHLINGLIIGLVFQPSHYFVGSNFYNGSAKGEMNWHIHQLETTVDIDPENPWFSHLVGSLNANVPHHLYPKVCHVHYPKLSAIINKLAQEYEMPYHRKSQREALKSHITFLKQLSKSNASCNT